MSSGTNVSRTLSIPVHTAALPETMLQRLSSSWRFRSRLPSEMVKRSVRLLGLAVSFAVGLALGRVLNESRSPGPARAVTMAGRPHELFRLGVQYYIAARFAFLAPHPQVAGSLFHQAFELIFKAA